MRKVLLGTTALAAVSMVAGGMVAGGVAQAQDDMMMAEPISLGLGGYYRAAIGTMSGDDGAGEPEANRHNTGIAQDVEILFNGETTLDNGLTAGVRLQMEGRDGSDTSGETNLDESWLYFRGGFGQFRLGSVESARQEFTNFAPSGASNFGVNSPFFTFAEGSGLATYDDGVGEEDAAKIVYLSPTFNGFSFGLSYAPDDSANGQQYGNNKSNNAKKAAEVKGEDDDTAPTAAVHSHTEETSQEYKNHIAIGGAYSQDVGGGNVRVAAGYETYEAEMDDGAACAATANCKPNSLHLGATVSFDQFSVGGGWLKVESASKDHDIVSHDLGVSWSEGPMSAGLLWGHKTEESGPGDTEINRYALNGTYVLGPGIDLQAQIDFGESDAPDKDKDGMPVTNDNEWTQFMIGTAITF